MKQIALATALSLYTTAAISGSMDAPVMEPVIQPVVIEEQTSSGGNGWIVPVLALLFGGLAAGN